MIRHARPLVVPLIAATAGLLFGAPDHAAAQARPAGVAAPAALGGARNTEASEASAANASGSLGVAVEAAEKEGVRIVSVERGGAADILGLRPGDVLRHGYPENEGSIWNRKPFDSVAAFNAWQATTRVGGQYALTYVPSGAKLLRATVVTMKAPGAVRAAAMGASPAEQARTAYLTLCGRGAEKVSATVCESMRRDLETQTAAEAAAAHEAEVMVAYGQLCAPGALKVSQATCAGMLAEAKRAPTPAVAARPTAQPAAASRAAPAARTQSSAFEELCAGAAPLVSAETCAALKADEAKAQR